jgi:hypothetical protein
MKKKAAPAKKVTPKKTTRRTVSRKRSEAVVPFTFQRIVLITTCLVLFVTAVVVVTKQPMSQSVAGVSVARGLFNQATVAIPQVNGAASYNIYYKQANDPAFTNAVRHVSPNVTTYTISYLKKGESYVYRVSAADASGKEIWWSNTMPLTNLKSM